MRLPGLPTTDEHGFFRETSCCGRSQPQPAVRGSGRRCGALPQGFSRDADGVLAFNRRIIEATGDLVAAYKPNLAFYESLGAAGWACLKATVEAVPAGVPVIGDGKRGDIGNTASRYAEALFDGLGFDAVTVNGYMGREAVEPFAAYRGRGVYVLCRTSNKDAAQVQTCPAGMTAALSSCAWRGWRWDGTRAATWAWWSGHGSGAAPQVRQAVGPRMEILIPGVGAQGGSVRDAVAAAGGDAFIINASRSILFASAGPDFADAARRAAESLRSEIEAARQV